MSKRELKKYLAGQTADQLSEQIINLYERFREVKGYFDFVFNPNEQKRVGEAKAKILNEYFPQKSRRARMRRTIAQKHVKHFIQLGVDPVLISDLMLFHIETAQRYASSKAIRYESFYKGMFKALADAVRYSVAEGILAHNMDRIGQIAARAQELRWPNANDFLGLVEDLH